MAKGAVHHGKVGWKLDEEFDHMRESKDFLKKYRKWLEANLGKRCKAKCNSCLCCEVWALYDLTEVMLP